MDMDGDLSQEAVGLSGMQMPPVSRTSQAQVMGTRHADFQGEAAVDESTSPNPGFSVTLDVYQGPFDVLLGLLANKRLGTHRGIALGHHRRVHRVRTAIGFRGRFG
jgi:segregation and condensation protein A